MLQKPLPILGITDREYIDPEIRSAGDLRVIALSIFSKQIPLYSYRMTVDMHHLPGLQARRTDKRTFIVRYNLLCSLVVQAL